MADKKAIAKQAQQPTSVSKPKFKWERSMFTKAMKAGQYNKAMSILETTLRTSEARLKWLQDDDIKEEVYKYFEWLKDQRYKAGEKDWKMHQQVIDETRELLGIEKAPQKIEVTVKPILGGVTNSQTVSEPDILDGEVSENTAI